MAGGAGKKKGEKKRIRGERFSFVLCWCGVFTVLSGHD